MIPENIDEPNQVCMSFSDAKEAFSRRKEEVETFFDFLRLVYDQRPDLSFGSLEADGHNFTRRISKMLLADGYLLIYNLVEATMTNLLDAVHSEAIAVETGFDGLRRELQLVILGRLKSRNLADLKGETDRLGRCLVKYALDTTSEERKVFKGNVDARKIRDIAESYGFPFIVDHERTGGGARLLQVKSWRNRLAHGSHSFEECGHAASVDELAMICKEAIAYLEAVMNRVETYLNRKEFAEAI